jgi:sulfur-oxidizing protein SoxY
MRTDEPTAANVPARARVGGDGCASNRRTRAPRGIAAVSRRTVVADGRNGPADGLFFIFEDLKMSGRACGASLKIETGPRVVSRGCCRVGSKKQYKKHHYGRARMTTLWNKKAFSRRGMLGAGLRLTGIGLSLAAFGAGIFAGPVSAAVGQPEPEEKINATIKRLFGDRKIGDGASMLKLDIPLIAENGSVVPTKVAALRANSGGRYIKKIYFLVDNNRRPMSASFSFTADAKMPFVGTNLRLGKTGPVRAVAEMSDGSLLQVMQEVKVTVGGCGG